MKAAGGGKYENYETGISSSKFRVFGENVAATWIRKCRYGKVSA